MDSPRVVAGTPYTTIYDMAGDNSTIGRGGNASGNRANKKKKSKGKTGGRAGGGGPPSAVGAGHIAQGPAVIRGVGSTVRFSNTEFVADVVALAPNNTVPVLTLAINPANAGLCPWLSRIATGYELYRFRRLVLRYTPTCSTSTSGMVVMAFDYDATDLPPNNKQTISAFEGATRGNVWSKLNCNARPLDGWYYVGATAGPSNPTGTDLKMYDMAKAYVAVFNQSTSGAVGELSIDYDVEFAKPDYSITPGLSEKLVPNNSTLTSMAGTNVAVTGNPVFSLSHVNSGVARLTAAIAGEFELLMVGYFTSNSALTYPGNPFSNCLQEDPNSYVTQNLAWDEAYTTGVAANTQYIFINSLNVSVLPGSVITLSFVASITAASLLRMRVASYKKALA